MKIGFFELEGWEEPIIREALPNDELFLTKEKLTANQAAGHLGLEAISVFINSPITADLIATLPDLKFITTRSTGFDHIDVAACKTRNIAVSYVPGYGENTVAEFTFGLMVNLTRKMYEAIDQIKERGSFALGGLRGIDLKGRTLGVVGTGRIGKEIIRISKGFQMRVIAFDLYPNNQLAQEFGFSYVTLEDLLRQADIVTLHCPYNKQTHHLINKDNIGLMKASAYLINTARGGIIETDALIKALAGRRIAGAGLDVLEEEGEIKEELISLSDAYPSPEASRTIVENHVLMKMPNVLITPHNAFNTQEALGRILTTTFENIKGFQTNHLVNLVS
ncbi:MAG TPA: NAD(P)-dependent oxidoreductase [Candidatus Paceibacterota bacterium]